MNIEQRLRALERIEPSGPLVVFGEPTPEQHRAIEEAGAAGRPVIRWPIPPPPLERDSSEGMQTWQR